MGNLKETRTRIASVKKTRQVTMAMKMVSAAKLKKAQGILSKFLPFTEKQKHILENIARVLDENNANEFFKESKDYKKVLIIVVSSNRGLCGSFNSNVIKRAEEEVINYNSKGTQVDLLTIGKKAFQLLGKNYKIIQNYIDIFDDLTYANVSVIANNIIELFREGVYDKIELLYNHSKSAGSQVVIDEDFLPILPDKEESEAEKEDIEYIFEPSKDHIINVLVPQILRTQLYKVLLDSNVAEHSARMISMNKATDNAGELLRELNLEYNKARQAAITSEILEIVSGAEALQSS